MAITRVYTKTGDDGITSLVGGVKVKKTNARIEAYGTVDELSAHLGMLASWMKDGPDKDIIIRTQRNLFTVCSYLATDKSKTPLAPSYTMDASETEFLEQQIDEINASIPQQTAFILPGGSHEAALAHVCDRHYVRSMHGPLVRIQRCYNQEHPAARECESEGTFREEILWIRLLCR